MTDKTRYRLAMRVGAPLAALSSLALFVFAAAWPLFPLALALVLVLQGEGPAYRLDKGEGR